MERTRDGRFRAERVKVDRSVISKALRDLKREKSLKWSEVAELFGVSEHTVRHDWQKNVQTLPIAVVRKIESQVDYEVKCEESVKRWFGQSRGGRNSSNSISISKPRKDNLEFAEFYGSLLGDGCIYTRGDTLCITGNAELDRQYIRYLRDISSKLFEIEPSIRIQSECNVVRLEIHSRDLNFFLTDFGFPKGKKKNSSPVIPERFFEDEKVLAACFRGLFDTDGGIYSHPHSGVMADITATSPSLLESLSRAEEVLELEMNETKDRIQLYGSDKLKGFFTTVGSSNLRNVVKYKVY